MPRKPTFSKPSSNRSVNVNDDLFTAFWDVFWPVQEGHMNPAKQPSFTRALEFFVMHFKKNPPSWKDLNEWAGRRMFGRNQGRPFGSRDSRPRVKGPARPVAVGPPRKARRMVPLKFELEEFVPHICRAIRAKEYKRYEELEKLATVRDLPWPDFVAEAMDRIEKEDAQGVDS